MEVLRTCDVEIENLLLLLVARIVRHISPALFADHDLFDDQTLVVHWHQMWVMHGIPFDVRIWLTGHSAVDDVVDVVQMI